MTECKVCEESQGHLILYAVLVVILLIITMYKSDKIGQEKGINKIQKIAVD